MPDSEPKESLRDSKLVTVFGRTASIAKLIAEKLTKHWPTLARILRVVLLVFFTVVVVASFLRAGASEHSLFVVNVGAHLVALMSGIVSFVWSAVEAARKAPLAKHLFWIVGFCCLLVAFEQAWRDEHRNTELVVGQRALAEGKLNTCGGNLDSATREAVFYREQTQSQQGTINQGQSIVNRCLDYLLKTSSPEPLSIITRVMTSASLKARDASGGEKSAQVILAVPSKDVPHLRVVVDCDQPFLFVEGKLSSPYSPGAGTVEQGLGTEWANTHAIKLTSPVAWHPDDPLVVIVAGDSLRSCEIKELR